jgi:hypothetical protein
MRPRSILALRLPLLFVTALPACAPPAPDGPSHRPLATPDAADAADAAHLPDAADAAPPLEAAPADARPADARPADARGADAGSGWWRPRPGLAWHWQLQGDLDMNVKVPVYEIDLFDNDAATIAALHRKGKKVICYVNAGAWEDWRPDAGRFPKAVLGARYAGYPKERWLDIRRLDLLAPLLRARLDQAKAKGCDAIEPDNIDGYTPSRRSGFPLKYADQLAFNRFIAKEAHDRGMAVALKNDQAQAKDLEPAFDFVVNEQCFQFGECDAYDPFLRAGKAVFVAEYELSFDEFCPEAKEKGISAIAADPALDGWSEGCP